MHASSNSCSSIDKAQTPYLKLLTGPFDAVVKGGTALFDQHQLNLQQLLPRCRIRCVS
jgi:hypothetical protein